MAKKKVRSLPERRADLERKVERLKLLEEKQKLDAKLKDLRSERKHP